MLVKVRSWLSRAVLPALTLGVAGAGLTACGGGSASKGPSLTLYNGQHVQTTQALVSAFERQTGISVKVRNSDENSLVQAIQQEGSSSPADVIFTENSPALMALQDSGALAPVPASVLAQVPSKYDSPAGYWVGVSARTSVVVYDTAQVAAAQLPTSVMDLADPRWKGKLALAPTETDFQPVVTSIAMARGDAAAVAWLKAVKANASSHIDPDNEAVSKDVNSGQAAIGLIDHYYWYRLAHEVGQSGVHSKVAYFAPGDPGFVVDVSGAGVLKSSRHAAQAQQLLQFLVSAAGQQVMVASNSFEYPLRPGAPEPPGLPPFSSLRPAAVTVADLGDGSRAIRLLQQAQLF